MKDILGYEGLYTIDTDGKIERKERSVTFLVNGRAKKHSRTLLFKGGVQKTWKNKYGYIMVSFSDGNGGKKNFYVHGLLMLAFVPNPDNKGDVNHKNGIKHDNRLENLEWSTRSENLIHALRTGLRKPNKGLIGKDNPSAFLKEKDIPVIRLMRQQGIHVNEIARKFGVGRSTIFDILRGKRWAHV